MPETDRDVEFIRQLFRSPPDVVKGMRSLLAFCSSPNRLRGADRAYALSYEKETQNLQEWVLSVLTREPPTDSIQAYYFGIFTALDKTGKERQCIHISGSEIFSESDEDWACSIPYCPRGRGVISHVLGELEQIAEDSGDDYTMMSYMLQIGFAGLAISNIMQALPRDLTLGARENRRLAVGFDEGDLFLLPQIKR